MGTIRMLPGVGALGAHTTTKVNGRTYTATAGTTVDVPDFDAAQLAANGWMDVTQGGGSGATTARPTTGLFIGYRYLDTTLGYVVVYDGATWRNPSSGASV